MYTNNYKQLSTFLSFVIVGIILGIIFDIFRISRKSFKTSDIITNIEDISYGIISGIIILFSIFLFNNGELRLFLFIGMLMGYILYILLISKYFIKVSIYIINIIKKIIKFFLIPFIFLFDFTKKVFLKPISFIFINFKKIYTKVFKFCEKIIKKDKKEVKEEGF